MDEITSEKSIKSARHLIKYLGVEKFLDYPDAEKFIEYRYAKDYNKCPGSLLWYPPAETEAVKYRSLPRNGEREFVLPNLIPKSKETRMAWDALNLIAQDLLRGENLSHPNWPNGSQTCWRTNGRREDRNDGRDQPRALIARRTGTTPSA